jgi:hypothetical protein
MYDVVSGKPNHSEPMMGDSDDIDQRDQISKGAAIFHHSALRARGYDLPDFDTIWDIGEEGFSAYRAVTPELPHQYSYFQQDSGNSYLRSGWGEKDTWVHFQCGLLGAGHGHADKLHVDITTRGEDILSDAGRYTYVFGKDRIAFKEMRAHNTVMVDGEDLYVCKDSWLYEKLSRAVNHRFYADERYAYTEGGHIGYMNLPSGGVFLNRRVILLGSDLVVLADEYYSSGAHRYNQFFHFAENAVLEQKGDALWHYLRGEANARLQFIRTGLSSKAVDSEISRHYNEKTPASCIETSFDSKGSGCAFTVIALGDKADDRAFSVEKLEVRSNFKDIVFTDKQIEALDIRLGAEHYTLAIAHEEYAAPTDTFLASGCVGFGSAVVFDRSAGETETGTVLAW